MTKIIGWMLRSVIPNLLAVIVCSVALGMGILARDTLGIFILGALVIANGFIVVIKSAAKK